jgi:hypothetical protein
VKGVAAVHIRIGKIRPQLHGAVAAPQRFIVPPQRRQCCTAIYERLGIVRPNGERPVVACERIVEAPQLLKRIATIVQRQNMSRFDFEGCVDLPNSGLGVPALHENDAEQMQAVEMRRLCCENLPIYFFRIGQSTGLMERQSLRKCRGRRRGAGYLPRGEEIDSTFDP